MTEEKIGSQSVLTFNPEESLLRGKIPLEKFEEIVKNQDETKIQRIMFSRNGYCNDAVLKLVQKHKKKDYVSLTEIILDGCILLTDSGIKWLSDILQGADRLEKIVLNGCINLADNELYLLACHIGPRCEISMKGTSVRYITDLEMNRVKVEGCPLSRPGNPESMKLGHVFVVPHKSMESSFCQYLQGQKNSKRSSFYQFRDYQSISSDEGGWKLRFTEIDLDHPLFMPLSSNSPVQIVIPFDDIGSTADVKKHVKDTVLKIISQEPFVGDYKQTKEKLEEASGAPVLYGTAQMSLYSLSYRQNINRQMLPIVDLNGTTIGQFECSVEYVDENDEPIKDIAAIQNAKYLINQEVKLKVKVNFASALPQNIQSSYCKYKLQNIFNYPIKTSEVDGINPFYHHERTFFVRAVTQKMLKSLQENPVVFELWGRKKIDEAKRSKTEKQLADIKPKSDHYGCEFVVVDTGKSGKVDQIKLTPSDFEETLTKLNSNIQQQESVFSFLDVHDQDVYASLCKTREKIMDFCQQMDRVHYMTVDITTEMGVKELKTKLHGIMDKHQSNSHESLYNIPQRVKRHLGVVKNLISVLDFSSGVFQPEEKEVKSPIPGNEVLELAKILQKQGEIAILRLGLKTVLADVPILVEIYNKLSNTSTMQSCDKRSTAIGQSSKVWTSETIAEHFVPEKGKKKIEVPVELVIEVVQEYFGLIQIPAIRFKETDTQFIYALTDTLSPPEVSLKEFWKLDTVKDFVILKKSYSFIHPIYNTLFPGILSSATQYGRTILLTKEGAVFQLGCVQTAVVMETDQSGYKRICLESRCYIPEKKTGPINEETVTNVTEYTWHIFCIYSDIINKLLKQTRIVYTVTADVQHGFVNCSVGCRHYWKPNPTRQGTTVCTLCNKCTDKGPNCSYNRIMGNYLRECLCKTTIQGCFRCGVCVKCVEKLWDVRSFLRPMPACPNIEREPKFIKKVEKEVEEEVDTTAVKDELEINPFQELAISGELFGEGQNEQLEKEPKFFAQLPLDPIANNEFEIQHISTGLMSVILYELNAGARMVVFPGQAMTFVDEDLKEEDVTERISQHCSSIMSYKYKFFPGDSIKVRLTDPFKAVSKTASSTTESSSHESKVVYHAAVWKGAIVSHETGLLCYDPGNSKGSNKSYFIGTRPFSAQFKSFSIKIVNEGLQRYIGLGVSADKSFKLFSHTGREIRQADFIKYYINRGGIFSQRGSVSQKDPSYVGDILTVNCDVGTKKLSFLKNGVQFYETDIEIPPGGYYPQITMHSEGECVQLLEKDPWMPDPTLVKDFGKPTAFDLYKYSNIWISPARTIKLSTLKVKRGDRYERRLSGWLILHNPTDSQLLYSVQPSNYVKHSKGCISPGESLPLLVTYIITSQGATPLETGVKVFWTLATIHKSWSEENIQEMFDRSSRNSIGVHRLNCVGKTSYTGDSEVPLFNESESMGGDNFKLEVFKNMERVSTYLVKKGNYIVNMYTLSRSKEPEYILKRTKSPSFLYTDKLQKRQSIIVKLEDGSKKEFAEALITDQEDDGYNLEYTPILHASSKSRKTKKEVIFCDGDNIGISDEDWNRCQSWVSENDVYRYVDPFVEGTFMLDPYLPAPPFLISKGSARMMDIYKPRWRRQILKIMSSCIQFNSLVTMQEENITQHSRELQKWIRYNHGRPEDSVVLLPSILDLKTLTFPSISRIFDNVSLHRLCFVHGKFLDSALRLMADEQFMNIEPKQRPRVRSFYSVNKKHHVNLNDGKMEISLHLTSPKEPTPHFMDIPGFPLAETVPVDLSYGCSYQSWTYVALLANKLLVPSFKQLMNGKIENSDREQVENYLYQMLQTYASLCSIYALQRGGLSNQLNPDYYSKKIRKMLKDKSYPKNKENNMLKDSYSFRPISNHFLACKAHDNHLIMIGHNLRRRHIDKFSLDEEYYAPYSEHLNTILLEGVHMISIPNSVFRTFKNIQVLSIMDVVLDFSVFPNGISTCNDLEILCLGGIKTLKELSKDIFQSKALRTVFFNNLPVRYLNIDWPTSSLMTSLTLTGLLLEEVPVGIGCLSNLEILVLDSNPITSLPDELEKLTQLKILSLRGIPWIELKGETEISLNSYQYWHIQNPFIMNYLSKQKTDDLFEEFDSNHTNVLSATELAKYNMYILLNVPRIGSDRLDDTKFGGVPPVLYKLKALIKLDLSYTAITMISEHAKIWENLISLKVEHCPLLESIDGQVGLLPNLQSIRINNCPSLETPPQDIVGRGAGAVKAFLKRIAGGYTECHRTKLMFIGLGQAGKTTLLEALRNPNKKTAGTLDPQLTDGIDIIPWVVPIEHNGRKIEITYSCWDFAGQTVYYNTHQFFLSKQAVYMLLWNMRMGFEHAGLEFWLSSVACHCPEAPVIIVGTQLDQIPMPDIPEDDLMEKYPQIKKFCYVSSTLGINIPELEKTLINVTMNHCTQMSLKIPKVWLSFENGILKERSASTNIMNWKQLTHCAIDNGLYEERDIRLAVEFLNDLGTVQYFDTEFLRDRVVINPQWIVDVMAKVVSVNEKSIKEHQGRFYHKFIKEIWSDYDPSLHQWMLKLTETFDLTFPLPEEVDKINIVPCLLPESKPQNLPWPYLSEEDGFRESTILYKFTYLPTGLFNRAQARLFSQGFTEHSLLEFIWKKGSILKKNQHYALVRQLNDYQMIVSVQGPRPKNVLDLIHETLSTLISDAFDGVHYDYYIQCPDCVEKEGTKEPFLFKAELISRAYSVNAPFLQCTKFFHTVSIGELLRIMPDSKDTEFDAQMQESISTLEEISRNMAKDVAILYASGDVPLLPMSANLGPEEAELCPVDVRTIHEDLKKAGLSCWFSEDIDKVSDMEMIMALKNSKVLVVCLSEEFVQNEKCHQWFLYATEQLHQPFAVAVMSAKMGWQHTDIGFKIGNPKMAMIKNMKRYPKKILDLIDIIKDQLENLERLKQGIPSVFISYCWSNSHEACSVTTEAKDGSLGYGDPRVIKKHLEKDGIRCWMDYEQMGKFGLYQDITVGLQNSKVLVICVSDEYLDSDACMMEARFGVHNMYLPIVVCVVGTGKLWKESEINLMVKKQNDLATVIKMQKESPGLYDKVLAVVKNYLERPETEKQRKVREKLEKARSKKKMQDGAESKIKQQGDTKFSFQEEIELVQRKFMRYTTKLSQSDETLMPRLLVVDFHDKLHRKASKSFLLDCFKDTDPDYARRLIEAIDEADAGKRDKAKAEAEKVLKKIADQLSVERIRRKESKLSYQEGEDKLKKRESGLKKTNEDNGIQKRESLMSLFEEERPESCMSNTGQGSGFDRVEKGKLYRSILAILEDCVDDEWKEKDLSLRVLCEFEQGWHFYGATVELDQITRSESLMKVVRDSAPYLARVYEILKQSGVDLNCSTTQKGENFLSHIRKEGTNNKAFAESYRMLRRMIEIFTESDDSWMYMFPRCILPNGKTVFLCEGHMHKMCATKVPYDSGSGGPNRILLTEQDRYLKEVLLENLDLVKMRREKSSLNEATKITEKRKVEVSKEKDQTVDRQVLGQEKKDPAKASNGDNEDTRSNTSRQSSTSTASTTTSNASRKQSQRRTSQACSLQ